MKKLASLLAVFAFIFALAGISKADEMQCSQGSEACPTQCGRAMVESYAHPSLFGTQTFEYSTDNGTVVMGGNIVKSKYSTKVKGKKNVFIKTWADRLLGIIKNQYKDANLFNAKMPTLRSEWAVVLTEGFGLDKNEACVKAYKDITTDYWATQWICSALDAGVMIGYPENVFKPDQPITKAEVFATIAQIVDMPIDADAEALMFKGDKMQNIPEWATKATQEVIATKLLENVPDPKSVIENEYLTKEQVAYIVGALRADLAYYQRLKLDKNAPVAIQKYTPVIVKIKLDDRISAKHSNTGDIFTAKTTEAVTIADTTFEKGSVVKGKVVEVRRPNAKCLGYVKVKLLTISNKATTMDFPKTISDATAESIKSPFFLSRLLAFPFTSSGRVLGVVGRSAGTTVNVCGNRLEEVGDNFGNVFVETIAGHPGRGAASFGNSFFAVGKGVWDVLKVGGSGLWGVVYEVYDEVVYVIIPSASNDASLNPNEELVVIF